MKKRDELSAILESFSQGKRPLPGASNKSARDTLAMQMIASLRRLDYTDITRNRHIHPERANPDSVLFDPERAAMLYARNGEVDEAVWLVFLSIHFGKDPATGWRRVRDVYSGLGGGRWTWKRVSEEPVDFRKWLGANRQSIGGRFGNHRKYESLDPDSPAGTAAVVESYVSWIGLNHSHEKRFSELVHTSGNDPRKIFDAFYRDMRVARFGRLGKFDFLALLGRLDLAPISPGSAYLKGATGPMRGARLLFGGSPTSDIKENLLDEWLCELDADLNVGMQVMEDSLCNWQKSPEKFVHFRG